MATTDIDPRTASDDDLKRFIADAQIPALLPALAHVTGDTSILRPHLAPKIVAFARDQGGLSPEQQAEAREIAFEAMKKLRDGGWKPSADMDSADLRPMLSFLTGGATPESYMPLLMEELSYPAKDARAPKWNKAQVAPERPFSVAIIGGGMSGILAAIRLQQAGVPFVILEKNADFGGTWFENRYPGARVDNANHLYSYSFAQKADWPFYYSPQPVLLDYFRTTADHYGIRKNVRFETEVTAAAWEEQRALWKLTVRTADGREETVEANAVVSAVGQLNRPSLPNIKGRDSYAGPWFHSARWNKDVDLKGKRVAVIGNGASASQFIPHVAEQAGDLKIFQRTASWYVPVPTYHDEVPQGLQWLFQHLPRYAQWYRFWLFWTSIDGMLAAAKVDPAWPDKDLAVSAANQQIRDVLTHYLETAFADRPDLLEKSIPSYPPASKRLVLDNGTWPATLKRPNVHLITDEIAEITPKGVRTCDGVEHEADVLIYGTGFQASRFLTPMQVTGRNGVDLHTQWDGDARAYMGVTIPGFPNFFVLYGPNTNIVVNGSTIYFAECEVIYLLSCIEHLLKEGCRSMECRKDAHDTYNQHIDAGNLGMAWGISKVPSWYKNEKGRVAQNWPFSLLEYWEQTQKPDPAAYVFS